MPNSKAAAWLAVMAAVGIARADQLVLKDDGRLSGTIRRIDAEGTLEFASGLAAEPLRVRASEVEKVDFAAREGAAVESGAIVELVNGDKLPGDVTGLDDKAMTVVSDDFGKVVIPREILKSLQVGVRQDKSIYSGPGSLKEWVKNEEAEKNWSFDKRGLVASGNGRIQRGFTLPPRFVLKFTLKWRNNPNFQVWFADPLASGRADRYILQFNGGGFELRREAKEGKRFQSVILLPRTPDQFPDNRMDVEIRVDRKESRLQLLINGVPEAAGFDPIPEKPAGGGVAFISNSAAGMDQEIRGIELRDYDDSQARHLAEERGDASKDSLISRDEDRLGGRLKEIRTGEGGNVFMLESDFQEGLLEIPERDVSTVFFAKPAAEAPAAEVPPLILHLRGRGILHVSSCAFSETTVTASHALLGELRIARPGIASLERLTPKEVGK